MPFSTACGPRFCAARWPALLSYVQQPPESSRFPFGNTAFWLAGPPISVIRLTLR